MPFDAQAGLGFAQHAIALGDFLKRCYQLDEQHDVLGLPILATGSSGGRGFDPHQLHQLTGNQRSQGVDQGQFSLPSVTLD